jgi:hypothetical protein
LLATGIAGTFHGESGDSSITYQPASGYVSVEEFCSQHLDRLHQFVADVFKAALAAEFNFNSRWQHADLLRAKESPTNSVRPKIRVGETLNCNQLFTVSSLFIPKKPRENPSRGPSPWERPKPRQVKRPLFSDTEGAVTVFAAVDHCTAECVGIHAVKKAIRFEALEPVRQGVKEYCGGFSAGVAAGLKLRHDQRRATRQPA